ncbi:DUF6602 domain-containing protein [Formosa sp. A9]|uniref:DUF6602 domain-containing protein n=1 Tax=Formosa sp. A9 TaxID=3442641 RepID=UPI003EBCDE4F
MKDKVSTYDLIKTFFKMKSEQLIAISNQAIVEHSSLKGSHRENLIDIYLKEILPKRFGIGKGMVYGILGKSKESDLIIWDEHNFPSLKLLGHSMFFVESVKSIMEIKTNWSKDVFNDIKTKKIAASKISSLPQSPNIEQRVQFLEHKVEAVENNEKVNVIFSTPKILPFISFIFNGGENFTIDNIDNDELKNVHTEYPDLTIFLKAGKVLEKQYVYDEDDMTKGNAFLNLHNAGENALLIFTSLLLEKLMINTNFSDYPLSFIKYGPPFYEHKIDFIEFPVEGQFPGIYYGANLKNEENE